MIIRILKKFFIKICRFFDFEIIDQNQFTSPTLDNSLNENEKYLIELSSALAA